MILMAFNACGAELELRALYFLPPEKTVRTGRVKFDVAIVVKNIGTTTITIPKGSMGPSYGVDADGNVLVSYSCSLGDFEGSKVKLAESELVPVKLLPGEVTMISYVLDISAEQKLEKIYFSYRVPPEMGQAYGLWTGEIKCQLKQFIPSKR